MQSRSRLISLVFLVIVVAIIAFFVLRRETQAAFGPLVALCPGPDAYGYTCEPGSNFAYIDATENLFLYEDDGLMAVDLPFPFTFYGTTYTAIQINTNGTLQFGSVGIPAYANDCLTDGPVAYMGDMVAPYWDDLDLQYAGLLETAVIGDAPTRIFVVEWDDVPYYGGDLDDAVTFEVQLFEASQDIVFLYQDVTTLTGSHGSRATIGLQSAAQGLSLQYSCDQPSVAEATGIHFRHPAQPNEALGLEAIATAVDIPAYAAKGPTADLLTRLNQQQPDALNQLQAVWRAQQPARWASWQELDLTGNGRNELLMIWHGDQGRPMLTQLAVIAVTPENQFVSLYEQRLSTRTEPITAVTLVDTVDLTGDGIADALLHDAQSGYLYVLTTAVGDLTLLPVPESCMGHLRVFDATGHGLNEIVRDGCATPGRMTVAWDGTAFVQIRP